MRSRRLRHVVHDGGTVASRRRPIDLKSLQYRNWHMNRTACAIMHLACLLHGDILIPDPWPLLLNLVISYRILPRLFNSTELKVKFDLTRASISSHPIPESIEGGRVTV